jgi:hypothetical protein
MGSMWITPARGRWMQASTYLAAAHPVLSPLYCATVKILTPELHPFVGVAGIQRVRG